MVISLKSPTCFTLHHRSVPFAARSRARARFRLAVSSVSSQISNFARRNRTTSVNRACFDGRATSHTRLADANALALSIIGAHLSRETRNHEWQGHASSLRLSFPDYERVVAENIGSAHENRKKRLASRFTTARKKKNDDGDVCVGNAWKPREWRGWKIARCRVSIFFFFGK